MTGHAMVDINNVMVKYDSVDRLNEIAQNSLLKNAKRL